MQPEFLKGKGLFYCFILVWLLFSASAVLPAIGAENVSKPGIHKWSEEEIILLRSLSIFSLPELPKDPSNRYADDPRAAALGKKLFFDSGFSANRKISCATCHLPEAGFTDKLPLAKGMGTTSRRTMPLAGSAYNSWFFWDGRKDSLWSQAIGPIESSVEHGFTRAMCAHLIQDKYKMEYEAVFGKLPRIDHKSCPPAASPGTGNPAALKAWLSMKPQNRDAVNRIYANIGKAIAAYVRLIIPMPAPFDLYVKAIDSGDPAASTIISDAAVEGLRLFVGKAECTTCHTGPLLTNSGFHNIGLRNPKDRGRAEGIEKVLSDEFNCFGKYSDAKPEECLELRFIDKKTSNYIGSFKTPSLRNVAERPPYFHAGQMKSLSEVLRFYRQSSSHELSHRKLDDDELAKIEAFLHTLSSPLSYPK